MTMADFDNSIPRPFETQHTRYTNGKLRFVRFPNRQDLSEKKDVGVINHWGKPNDYEREAQRGDGQCATCKAYLGHHVNCSEATKSERGKHRQYVVTKRSGRA